MKSSHNLTWEHSNVVILWIHLQFPFVIYFNIRCRTISKRINCKKFIDSSWFAIAIPKTLIFKMHNFNCKCNLARNICAIINNQLIKNSLMHYHCIYHRIYFLGKIYFTKKWEFSKIKGKTKSRKRRDRQKIFEKETKIHIIMLKIYEKKTHKTLKRIKYNLSYFPQ